MKRKGFTLIELLAVLVILGVIALVVFPNVTSSIKKSKEQGYQQQVKTIEDNARRWGLDHNDELSEIKNHYITIDDLQREGYIANKEVKDPRNDSIMNGCIVISYSNNYQQYIYQYNERPCSEIRQNYLVDLTDNYVESGPGIYKISANEYRYRGGCEIEEIEGVLTCQNTDPINNYISINGQKYRIISFDKNGIKVITAKALANNLPFDDGSRNNANNTFCQKGGDDSYWGCNVYAAINGIFTAGNKSGTVTQNSSLYDYLNNTGIDIELITLRNKALLAPWNVGPVYETSNGMLSEIQKDEKEYTANFKIGLINPSEYIYASLDENCPVKPLGWGATGEDCMNLNWLGFLGRDHMWTMNPGPNEYASSLEAWVIRRRGTIINIDGADVIEALNIYPTAYISLGTTYTSGTGTETDPYIIS